MPSCDHNCENCNIDCEERDLASFKVEQNQFSNISHVIAVTSGKGGVGKSFVCSLLASQMAKAGFSVGILDADITGPSIPKMFGVSGPLEGTEEAIIPETAECGIKIMSAAYLLNDASEAIIWRGPLIGGLAVQFFTDVAWGDLDYLFVDMPPGTSDVALSIYQSLPVEKIVVVTTPQDLVSMIVEKSFDMAKKMDLEITGLICNMSYFVCSKCGEKEYPFGKPKLDLLKEKYGLKATASLPIAAKYSAFADHGMIYEIESQEILDFVKALK